MKISRSEAKAWLELTLNPRLKPELQRALLARYGPPEELANISSRQIAAEFGPDVAQALREQSHAARVAAALTWHEAANHFLLPLNHALYPKALWHLNDPPLLLYLAGNPELLSAPSLAIVGARRATPAGIQTAKSFAAAFVAAGLSVVSGLAYGIDAAAHEGALAARREGLWPASTIAVVGTGLDRVYPAAHRALFRQIVAEGAVVSEFPLGAPPLAFHFPRRNRIIAALSLGTLVVEASLDSGSLITAQLAAELGREVFAIPGSIQNPLARGCHRLIREGAKLVESVEDVLEELRLPSASPRCHTPTPDEQAACQLAPDESKLWQALGYEPTAFETLVARTQLPAEQISALLLTWELEGKVARLAGNRYQKLG